MLVALVHVYKVLSFLLLRMERIRGVAANLLNEQYRTDGKGVGLQLGIERELKSVVPM
jgi:hypothetical protein